MCPSPPSSSIPREPSSCQHDFLEYLKCLLRYSFLIVPKIHQHHRWHCVSRPLLATNKALRTLLRQCFGVLNSRKKIFDVSVTGDADVSAGAYCFRVCGRFSPSLNYVICFTWCTETFFNFAHGQSYNRMYEDPYTQRSTKIGIYIQFRTFPSLQPAARLMVDRGVWGLGFCFRPS